MLELQKVFIARPDVFSIFKLKDSLREREKKSSKAICTPAQPQRALKYANISITRSHLDGQSKSLGPKCKRAD
jgi:hypothetical protein